MNYAECLKYLQQIQNLGIKFGLKNVEILLSSLDEPHKKYPSVLVAGTNGKGSVCALLAKILTLQGFRAGLYTSPHLVQVEERIRIGDELISGEDFCGLLSLVREKIESLVASGELASPPTYFELLTCLAFLYFGRQRVDLAVLEVGMGGRLDATNVVLPKVSVITTISLEHQKYLGETLTQIAFEKAGIIKPGVPVVCGEENPQPYRTIRERAEELEAPFTGVFDGRDCFHHRKERDRFIFEYKSGRGNYLYTPSLQGFHQGKNAAMAIAAAEWLDQTWRKLPQDKILEGVETASWEGRLELISQEPYLLVDGAHNEAGARALRDYLQDFIHSPLILVFAVMRDKKIEKLAEILFPLAERVILTGFPFFKAASPQEIKEKAQDFKDRLMLEPDTRRALSLAFELAGRTKAILVTGSLFLVGEVKKLFPRYGQRLKVSRELPQPGRP